MHPALRHGPGARPRGGQRPGGESPGPPQDEKALDAEQLADLLEEQAEALGPPEMSLDVECEDGVDTAVQDYEAACIAYADEGVEHPWVITAGPADGGLEIEVANED